LKGKNKYVNIINQLLTGGLLLLVIQSLRADIERMLKRVKEITYEPQLLSPSAEQNLSAAAAAGKLAYDVISDT